MRALEPELVASGAHIAAIGLGDMPLAREFRVSEGITFPLLVDEERAAYRAAELKTGSVLDIFRPSNWIALVRAWRTGSRQGKTGKNPLQLGGSFVFGPGDVDLWAHASETFGDNAPAERLLAVVRDYAASRGR